MKNAVTTKEVIYAFAKLEPVFNLSPLYRMGGFFDQLDEMIARFEGKTEVAYRTVAERAMTAPEKLRGKEAEFDKTQYPTGYDGTVEDWLEECSQIGDILFCVAVCILAHLPDKETIDGVCGYIKGKVSKSAMARMKAIGSTMNDLRTGVNKLFSADANVVA